MMRSIHAKRMIEVMKEANLSPADTLGKPFLFAASHGSHSHLLYGTVTGIMWSDEGGLMLFVSIPEIWGRPLKCLMYNDGTWSARLHIDQKEKDAQLARLPDDGSEETDRRADEIIERHMASQFIRGEFGLM